MNVLMLTQNENNIFNGVPIHVCSNTIMCSSVDFYWLYAVLLEHLLAACMHEYYEHCVRNYVLDPYQLGFAEL